MTSPRIRPRFGGGVRPGLLAPLVVAIVLGILGMHGIGAHGVNLHGPMAHADNAATPTTAVMAGHDSTTAGAAFKSNDVHTGGEATATASDQPDDQMGGMNGMGGMVMLCMAMLASAAVALLVVLVRRRRRPKVWAVLAPSGRVRAAMPALLRVGTGPPAVWRFSIIRC